MIYNCLAGSYLRYGIVSWGAAAPSALCKLKTLQNRIIRYMTFLPPRTNVDHKYKALNILTAKELYFFEVSKLVHSISNGYAPSIFLNYLPSVSHHYQTRLRHHNSFSLSLPRTERGKRSLLFVGVSFWSKVPAEIKTLSKKPFGYALKKYLFENDIPL